MEEEEIEELEEIEEEHIQDILAVRNIIATHWYLSHEVVQVGMGLILLKPIYIITDAFGRDPHISSKRQKKGHLRSNTWLIELHSPQA